MKPPKTEQQLQFEEWFKKLYPTHSLARHNSGSYRSVPACYMWKAIVAANNNFKLKEDNDE